MRRICNGRFYETDTATKIANVWFDAGDTTLYRTRGGAYFVAFVDHHGGGGNRMTPLTHDQAMDWMMNNSAHSMEVFEQPFGPILEAVAADDEPSVYVRIPRDLADVLTASVGGCAD